MDYNLLSGTLILLLTIGLAWVGFDTIWTYQRQQYLQQIQHQKSQQSNLINKQHNLFNLPALLETDYFLGWLALLFGLLGTGLMLWNLWTVF